MLSWKQCALPVITTLALWQLMYLGTWCTVMCPSAWVATKSLGDNREGTLFSWWHICYAHFASVRFEHSVCCGSLMTTSSVLQLFIYFHCFNFFLKNKGNRNPYNNKKKMWLIFWWFSYFSIRVVSTVVFT